MKKIIAIFILFGVCACCAFTPLNKEEEKNARTKAAQQRIDATQRGAGSIAIPNDTDIE